MSKPRRSKPKTSSRSRVHRDRVKAGRRRRLRPRAETAVQHSRRRARVAAKGRRFFRR